MSSSSVTADSASWRSVVTSSSDQSRGSGPKTQSAPIDLAAPPGQRGAEVGAHRARGHRREEVHAVVGARIADDQRAGPGRGDGAERLLERALAADDTGRQAAAGRDDLDVGEHRDLAGGRTQQSGGEFRQAVQSVRACRRPGAAGAPRRCGRRRGSVRRQRASPDRDVRDGSVEPSTGALLPGVPPGMRRPAPLIRRSARADQLCHGGSVARNQPDADHAGGTIRTSSRSRDDEGERGAAVMFHVQPRPPQQPPAVARRPSARPSWSRAAGRRGPCAPC